MAHVRVREAREEDCEQTYRLVKALAEFENLADDFKLDIDTFKRDGFGKEPCFHCFVAEEQSNPECHELIGVLVYTWSYSLWLGGFGMYIMEVFITDQNRGKGVGTALFEKAVKFASERGACRIQTSVRKWNTPAINFYKKIGFVNETEESHKNILTLSEDAINAFVEKMGKD